MIRTILSLLLLLTGLSCGSPSEPASTQAFEVHRGTNIAHWLSQSKRRGAEREQFFTQQDVAAIADMGFDHIRLPIDEEQMWDEAGNRQEDAFQLLENCVKWCEAADLRIIVDLHILRSHHFNAKEKPLWTDPAEQEKFFDLWRDLSRTLQSYPNHLLAYELMNEAVADEAESWNQLIAQAFAAIRELEPKRTIVIGSNRWQSVNTFDELVVPPNDPNILLSFHFYEPFLLTHYRASWTELKDYQGPVHYPGVILTESEFSQLPDSLQAVGKKWVGREFSQAEFLRMWQQPINKAKQLGLPLYCGEFGIMATAPEADRLRWYQDMIDLLDAQGIGYANWNYRSDNFGLIDGTERRETLIQLVGGKQQ